MTSKGEHDPGWNDPPTFTYDKATAIQNAASSKKGTQLNKRVPFPLNDKAENIKESTTGCTQESTEIKKHLLTQPPQTVPSSCLFSKTEIVPSTEIKILGKDKFDEVLSNLEIDICDGELVKRIKIMEKMWVEDKLDNDVKLKILELSQALLKGDAELADHIQKSLMVDKISQCSSWMSGIRQLINQKRQEQSQF